MPRQKGKGKLSGKAAPNKNRRVDTQGITSGSDDDSFSETASMASVQDYCRSQHGDDDVDPEHSAQEQFEDKLQECIDGATQKSAQGRQNCLQGINTALCRRIVADFLQERRLTLTDVLEKSLKKGKGDEQALSALIAMQVCIQLGCGNDGVSLYNTLKPLWMNVISDKTAPVKARATCCSALGMCAFIVDNDMIEIDGIMKCMEQIFHQSYLKGNGEPPSHPPEVTGLHAAALSAWSLLLYIVPQSSAEVIINKHLPRLAELLYSSDVELRIIAGEVIALCYEIMREDDDSFEGDDIEELCTLLRELATDGSKNRGKKERRHQRSSFRDILKCVEDGEYPEMQVRFGTESLRIDCWTKKRQYDSFCHALSSGINLHLKENELLREIFELGNVLPDSAIRARRSNKVERHMFNEAAFKARTKIRSKARDKRMTAVMMQ